MSKTINRRYAEKHKSDILTKQVNRHNDSPLVKELTTVLNRHSTERHSNTPDFILANYLFDCLYIFGRAVNAREAWYNRTPSEHPLDCVYNAAKLAKHLDNKNNHCS